MIYTKLDWKSSHWIWSILISVGGMIAYGVVELIKVLSFGFWVS